MPNLSSIEKKKIEKLLKMGDGYVLDFSNETFQEFITESVGVDIYEDKYAYFGIKSLNTLLENYF